MPSKMRGTNTCAGAAFAHASSWTIGTCVGLSPGGQSTPDVGPARDGDTFTVNTTDGVGDEIAGPTTDGGDDGPATDGGDDGPTTDGGGAGFDPATNGGGDDVASPTTDGGDGSGVGSTTGACHGIARADRRNATGADAAIGGGDGAGPCGIGGGSRPARTTASVAPGSGGGAVGPTGFSIVAIPGKRGDAAVTNGSGTVAISRVGVVAASCAAPSKINACRCFLRNAEAREKLCAPLVAVACPGLFGSRQKACGVTEMEQKQGAQAPVGTPSVSWNSLSGMACFWLSFMRKTSNPAEPLFLST